MVIFRKITADAAIISHIDCAVPPFFLTRQAPNNNNVAVNVAADRMKSVINDK